MMNLVPSEYPNLDITNAETQVYMSDGHGAVEQSAIYKDVSFHCLGETSLGIVLTAQCDIARAKPASYLLLARLTSVERMFSYWAIEEKRLSEEEVDGSAAIATGKLRKNLIREFVSKYMENKTFQYYYLPALPGKIPASLICCDVTVCVAVKSLQSQDKLCVLRSPFREAVPAYYAAYIGRVGTPQHQPDSLTSVVESICKVQDC
jgi:hypothetical protein